MRGSIGQLLIAQGAIDPGALSDALARQSGRHPVASELYVLGYCSERQLWGNIVLPASLPFIVTGIRLAVGRGMIGMVLADLYTAISGIGYLIVRTASTFQVDKMFVPIVTLGLLGVTLTALLRVAEKRVAPWTAAAQED